MTKHGHAHPLPGDRRFEHVHPYPVEPEHAALPPEQAHPDMAGVERAPEPGSPTDYRRAAAELREQAAWHRRMAEATDRSAAELETRAEQDKQQPPSQTERVRRLLEGGLS